MHDVIVNFNEFEYIRLDINSYRNLFITLSVYRGSRGKNVTCIMDNFSNFNKFYTKLTQVFFDNAVTLQIFRFPKSHADLKLYLGDITAMFESKILRRGKLSS